NFIATDTDITLVCETQCGRHLTSRVGRYASASCERTTFVRRVSARRERCGCIRLLSFFGSVCITHNEAPTRKRTNQHEKNLKDTAFHSAFFWFENQSNNSTPAKQTDSPRPKAEVLASRIRTRKSQATFLPLFT